MSKKKEKHSYKYNINQTIQSPIAADSDPNKEKKQNSTIKAPTFKLLLGSLYKIEN